MYILQISTFADEKAKYQCLEEPSRRSQGVREDAPEYDAHNKTRCRPAWKGTFAIKIIFVHVSPFPLTCSFSYPDHPCCSPKNLGIFNSATSNPASRLFVIVTVSSPYYKSGLTTVL